MRLTAQPGACACQPTLQRLCSRRWPGTCPVVDVQVPAKGRVQLCGSVEHEHEPAGHMALSTTGAPSSSTEHAEAAHSVWSDGKAPAVPQLTGRVPAADMGRAGNLSTCMWKPNASNFVRRSRSSERWPAARTSPQLCGSAAHGVLTGQLVVGCLPAPKTQQQRGFHQQPCTWRLAALAVRAAGQAALEAKGGSTHSSLRAGKALGLPQESGSGPATQGRQASACVTRRPRSCDRCMQCRAGSQHSQLFSLVAQSAPCSVQPALT